MCRCTATVRLCLVDCCHSHQQPSSQISPVSPGHLSGPLNTYRAHPQLTSVSFASESARLHAEAETEGKVKHSGALRSLLFQYDMSFSAPIQAPAASFIAN